MTPSDVRASFPADPASASEARRLVDRTLAEWGCEELRETAALLVGELVANAVLHAGTTIDVAVRRVGDRLRVEVQDGSERLPVRKHYSSFATTGRGLLLVERLSDEWGAEPTPSGKTVWFELSTEGVRRDPGLAMVDFGDFDFDLEELADEGPGPRDVEPWRGPDEGGPALRVLQPTIR